MSIPPRDRYLVEPATLVVHEPYTDHATGMRTTPLGMASLTMGNGTACEVCFPPPPKQSRRRGYIGDTIVEPVTESPDAPPYWETTSGDAFLHTGPSDVDPPYPTRTDAPSADEGIQE